MKFDSRSRRNVLDVDRRPGLNLENPLLLHSLNASGIPVLTKGEDYRLKPLAEIKLPDKVRTLAADYFAKHPIFNSCFHQNEVGEWVNASAFVEVNGFDNSQFEWLQEPRVTTVGFLEVNEAVVGFSGCRQMVQIGFNVGGGEIVFKRILLPGNYQLPNDWSGESLVYRGSKMPEVFVEAWDKLKVGDYDPDWDLRVREQLTGNRRDMDKRVVYQMIGGEKWIEWNGVKMWAGLLSDRRDIGRFLAEEQALAGLKPGEFLAAKYSHGDGGAISAATSQERDREKPKIVGDVQMMSNDGKIFQAAVEGDAGQIDGLISELADQLRRDYNLPEPFLPETALPLPARLAAVPVLPMAMYPGKFFLGEQPEAMPANQLAAVILERRINTVTVALPIIPIVDGGYWLADTADFIDFEFSFKADDNSSDQFDWGWRDDGPDWDNGGGGSLEIAVPVPSGSHLEGPAGLDPAGIDNAKPVVVQVPTRTVPVGRVVAVEKQGESDRSSGKVSVVIHEAVKGNVTFSYSDRHTKTFKEEQHYSATIQPLRFYLGRKREVQEAVSGRVPEGRPTVVLPPEWRMRLDPLNEKEIPLLQPWPMDLDYEAGDLTIFIVTRHYAILNTKELQPVKIFTVVRGSG